MRTHETFGVVARPKAPFGYTGRWVNIYLPRITGRVHAGGAYCTWSEATAIAKPHRYDCVYVWIKKQEKRR